MAGENQTPKAASFTELYQNHGREVYQFALYLSGDPALAEDIVSETFLRIWDSSANVRMETVRGYLFTIARNLFLHSLRSKRRQDPLEDHLLNKPAVAANAIRDLEAKQDLRDTLAALQTLPELDRAAVLMRAQEGVSYEEIARILGLSLSAVKVKIHRARVFLAQRRKGVAHAITRSY
jgi:RNA polymerase sigma-70 factor (ECF subfamily)